MSISNSVILHVLMTSVERRAGRLPRGWQQRTAAALGIAESVLSKLKAAPPGPNSFRSLNAIPFPELSQAAAEIFPTPIQRERFLDSADRLRASATAEAFRAGLTAAGLLPPEQARTVFLSRRVAESDPGETIDEVPLSAFEQAELARLAAALSSAPGGRAQQERPSVAVLAAAPHSGAGYALQRLHVCAELDHDAVLHVRPPATGGALGPLIAKARTILGLDPDELDDVNGLHAELRKRRILLVVHHAHLFGATPREEEDAAASLTLAELVGDPDRRGRGRATLLVWPWAPVAPGWLTETSGSDRRIVRYDPRVGAQEAEALFDRLLDVYQQHQASAFRRRPSAEGPRRKRFRAHVRRITESGPALPVASLRVRAAAMSDVRNLSEADPTQGWRSLIGPAALAACPTLRAIEEDVRSVLTVLAARDPEWIRCLRAISSCLHWLGRDMVEDLGPAAASWAKLMELVTNFRAGDEAWSIVYSRRDGGVRHRRRLSAPLALRAVVQDDWMTSDPDGRAALHLAMSNRLEHLGPTDFAREYPHAAPGSPERAGLVLHAEALRHAMRASRRLPRGASGAVRNWDAARRRLPAEGLYSLELELLHLLSSDGRGSSLDGRIERQSPALAEAFQHRLGVARFALLHLHEARAALQRGAADAGCSFRSRAACTIRLAGVETLSLDLPEAARWLARSKELLAGEVETDPLRRWIAVAEARLKHAAGDLEGACGAYDALADLSWPNLVESEAALSWIDACMAFGDAAAGPLAQMRHAQALELAERNVWRSRETGRPHLAMRFELRRARLILRLDRADAAEAIVETVALQLARWGGSAFAFHEFQAAAGEILAWQGWGERAVARYLWSCWRRALHRGADLLALEAAHLLQPALAAMSWRRGRGDYDAAGAFAAALAREPSAWPSDLACVDRASRAWTASAARTAEARDRFEREIRDSLPGPAEPFHSFDLGLLFEDDGDWAEIVLSAELQRRVESIDAFLDRRGRGGDRVAAGAGG